MNKITIAIIVALLLGLGGLAVWTSLNPDRNTKIGEYDTKQLIPANEENGGIGDHYRGNPSNNIIVVEYADLQCPGCATMMPKMSKLYKQYGDRVGFIFRSYPISGHQNARSASAAVEAAGQQGFFWEMLESMYDNRADWISIFDTEKRTNTYASIFEKVAGADGDRDRFINSLNDSNILKKVEFDKALGSKYDKVNATPSIFINGEQIDIEGDGSKPVEDVIEEKLNDLLKKAGFKTGRAEEEVQE